MSGSVVPVSSSVASPEPSITGRAPAEFLDIVRPPVKVMPVSSDAVAYKQVFL